MEIYSTLIRLSKEEAGVIACKEYPDLLTRLFYLMFPRSKKKISLVSVQLFYCKYYTAWGVVTSKRGKRASCNAAMCSAFPLVKRMAGFPETQLVNVEEREIAEDRYDESEADRRLREFILKETYRKLRMFGDVKLTRKESVYKPFYCCICEKNGNRITRVVDAEIGERDYLMDIQYKNLIFPK